MKQEPLKHTIGMTVIFVIAVLSIIGGVLLFPNYILTGGCFALSSILLYVFFGEIKYRKGNDEILKENTTPRETIIRLSNSWKIFKTIGYGILIAFGGYLIYLGKAQNVINNHDDYFLLGVGGFFIIASSVKLIRMLNLKQKIIINNKGINYDSKNLIPWSEIKNEHIITKMKTSRGEYDIQYEAYYLSFKNKKELIEICLEDYDITDNQMAQLLKIYRSRYSS